LTASSATVYLAWEKVKISFKVETDIAAAVKTAMEAAMKGDKKDPRVFIDAASTYYENNLDMNLALTWIEESVKIRPGIGNLALKGRILAKLGKKDEAAAALEKAIDLAAAAKRPQADIDRLKGYLREVKGGEAK
jgi:tetratricopeptide (TPR) repeat protein